MSYENVEKLIKDHKVEFVDLRFTDMRGVQHHVTFPKSIVEPALFEDGKMFDGSSISGWKGINESDMILLPDASTAFLDPFTADPTLVLTCDILDPATMQAYSRDPRGVAKRAEAYLKSSGVADQAFDVARGALGRDGTVDGLADLDHPLAIAHPVLFRHQRRVGGHARQDAHPRHVAHFVNVCGVEEQSHRLLTMNNVARRRELIIWTASTLNLHRAARCT